MTSHGSHSPDTAQHYNSNMGNEYGALTSPFLAWVCTSISHNNCKRLNAIPSLLRRKLSLGEFQSFAPSLTAPEWHGRNSEAVLSPALIRTDSQLNCLEKCIQHLVCAQRQPGAGQLRSYHMELSVSLGRQSPPSTQHYLPLWALTQPPSWFLRT